MSMRKLTRDVRAEAERVLREHFGDRLHVDATSARYGGTSFTLKFEFAKVGEDGEALTKERKAWALHAPANGLPEDAVGTEFEANGDTFRITGWNTRAKKYPVQAERVSDGRGFKFPARSVRVHLDA